MLNEYSSLADRFRMISQSFQAGGSALYERITNEAAFAAGKDSEFAAALEFTLSQPDRSLPVHRLLAAAHRWVLRDEEPLLAMYYPSVGGTQRPDRDLWQHFRDAVVRRAKELPNEMAGDNQHNEPGRAVPLSCGFLELSQRYPMPHRLLEVGASAGLLLIWDQYVYDWRRYRSMFENPDDAPLDVPTPHIAERLGCDLNPIDPCTEEGSLRLRSFVWADLADNHELLDLALGAAHKSPPIVVREDGITWLERHLHTLTRHQLTVVYQSLVPADQIILDQMTEVVFEAGSRAAKETPLAYLQLHVVDVTPGQPVRCCLDLTTWPGEQWTRLLTCDLNGRHIELCEGATRCAS
jgi:hypothetical protein